ncbi:MAG: nitrous oxide reductase family maturation protein NosD [Thermoplasmata archaeon]
MVKNDLSKLTTYLLALILFLSISAAGLSTAERNRSDHSNLDYTTHQPIKIDNDTDLTNTAKEENWRGEGTEQDPYIIENYSIDGEEKEYCIWIKDTTQYFVIKNCFLHDTSYNKSYDPWDNRAIHLQNVENGFASNNYFIDNKYSIYLEESRCEIENNYINNNEYGFYLKDSDSNIIKDNQIYNCNFGVYFTDSKFNEFFDNFINKTYYAIYLDGSAYNNLNNNNVTRCDFSFRIILSGSTKLKENVVHDNERGIIVDRSNDTEIVGNRISNTNETGIDVLDSDRNIFQKNEITKGSGYGIYLHTSDDNIIKRNAISNGKMGELPDWEATGSAVGLHESDNNIVSHNNLSKSYWGVFLGKAENNRIEYNTIKFSSHSGIKVWGDHENTVVNNSISSADDSGIILERASSINIEDNTIYDNNGEAIQLLDSKYNMITDNDMYNNHKGLSIVRSEDNTFSKNMINKNNYGILIKNSEENVLTDNRVTKSKYRCFKLERSTKIKLEKNNFQNGSIYISGDMRDHWDTHTIPTSNTANGQPVYYWKDRANERVPTDAGEVILVNCSDINVEDLDIREGSVGVLLGYSDNTTIENNELADNDYGIYLWHSDSNRIENNQVELSRYDGIDLTGSDNNVITENTVLNKERELGSNSGIDLIDSHNTTIKDCIIKNNDEAIEIDNSNYSLIEGNEISSNIFSGIFARACKGNTIVKNTVIHTECKGIYFGPNTKNNSIYMNNFIDNRDDPIDKGKNQWDNGEKGNYWSDYEEPYPCASELRFSDTWDATIDIKEGNNQDNHPLVEPVGDMDEDMESSCIYLMSFIIILIIITSIIAYRKIKNTE